MTPRDAYRLTLQALKQAGVPDPAPDAGWLLGHVLNRPALEARLDLDTVSLSARKDLCGIPRHGQHIHGMA